MTTGDTATDTSIKWDPIKKSQRAYTIYLQELTTRVLVIIIWQCSSKNVTLENFLRFKGCCRSLKCQSQTLSNLLRTCRLKISWITVKHNQIQNSKILFFKSRCILKKKKISLASSFLLSQYDRNFCFHPSYHKIFYFVYIWK